MVNQYKVAVDLINIEEELNVIQYNNIGVGHLFCKLNANIYRDLEMPNTFRLIVSFLKLILKGLTISFPKNKIQTSKILLSKIANKNQCNALIDPLKAELKEQAIIYSPVVSQNEIIPYNFSRALRLKSVLRIGRFVFINSRKISDAYKSKNIIVGIWNIRFTLFLGLTLCSNWKIFLASNAISKVIVDFDRDQKNAALILAARNAGIPCISLVHGVINPPYGYYPIIADEIWVWGNYQKKQMQAFGLKDSRIKIVGNPIASISNKMTSEISKNLEVITIGIAINPMGEFFNRQMLQHILKYKIEFFKINWIIKLHPSMKKKAYILAFESENVSVKSFSELDNESFINKIDLLLINNSGIGYEALVNDVPVMVYLANEESIAHDYVMITEGHAPKINDSDAWYNLLKLVQEEGGYLEDLLEKEKIFLKEYYYEIGVDATSKILKNITEIEGA